MIDDILKIKETEYEYTSHAFNPSIIISYNNLFKYPLTVFTNGLFIKQLRKKSFFCFQNTEVVDNKLLDILSETPFPKAKKIKEVVYNLDEIFTNPSKEVRRAITLTNRPELSIRDIENSLETIRIAQGIFDDWKNAKEADPKVFRMTFSPGRYLRSYSIPSSFGNYQKIVYIKNKPYALINFSFNKNKPIAYEISFVSRFFDKELKIINDLNFCILVNCFYDLWKNYKISQINVGPTAGIKGLAIFKNKLPHEYQIIYSN